MISQADIETVMKAADIDKDTVVSAEDFGDVVWAADQSTDLWPGMDVTLDWTYSQEFRLKVFNGDYQIETGPFGANEIYRGEQPDPGYQLVRVGYDAVGMILAFVLRKVQAIKF